MSRNRPLTLPEFIKLTGVDNAAKLFGVPPRTIVSWRRRDRFPKPENARKILDIAATHEYGPLTYESIYKIDETQDLKIGVEVHT